MIPITLNAHAPGIRKDVHCKQIDLDARKIVYLTMGGLKQGSETLIDNAHLRNSQIKLLDLINHPDSIQEAPNQERLDRIKDALAYGFKSLNIELDLNTGKSEENDDAIISLTDYGLSICWDSIPIGIVQKCEKSYRHSWVIMQDTYVAATRHQPEDFDVTPIAYYPPDKEINLVAFIMEHVSSFRLSRALEAVSDQFDRNDEYEGLQM